MKSNMSGIAKAYWDMLETIRNWDESIPCTRNFDGKLFNEPGHYLEDIDWTLGDAGYHGWSGEALKREYEIYEDIKTKYRALKEALIEAAPADWNPKECSTCKYRNASIKEIGLLCFECGDQHTKYEPADEVRQ